MDLDPGFNEPNVAPERAEERRYQRLIRSICDRTALSADEARSATLAVLCVLRQHLSGGEWLKSVSDFDEAIRPAIEVCGAHRNANPETFGREEFLRRVGEHFGRSGADVEPIVRAVFHGAIEELSPDHARGIEGELPNDLRELWQAEEIAPGIPR